MMRIATLILFTYFLGFNFLKAQELPLRLGYYVNPSYSLYQRCHLPNNIISDGSDRSTGQVLNLLPDLSAGLWVGQARNWALGLEAGVNFAPFSLNRQNYQGLGQLQFPFLLRAFLPIKKHHSSAISLNIASGMQLNRTHLYARGNNSPDDINTQFLTYLLEVAGGIAAISQKSTQIRGLDLFFRFGFGANQALSFQSGLRLHFWNSFKQK